MKNRISQLFNHLIGEKRAGLGIFITAGDPNLEISQKIFDMLRKVSNLLHENLQIL